MGGGRSRRLATSGHIRGKKLHRKRKGFSLLRRTADAVVSEGSVEERAEYGWCEGLRGSTRRSG